ncbi:hypothetical protein FGO68_gene3180 [Halteria grandinella]|uniref:Uncharacterized protein n=1 Tax=Halteria grandinella TaxID=5974 RepID=A0A8J8NE56_HALGN|nr:hypothetical protein FGO68_gene3180 [Halteria grandinella]
MNFLQVLLSAAKTVVSRRREAKILVDIIFLNYRVIILLYESYISLKLLNPKYNAHSLRLGHISQVWLDLAPSIGEPDLCLVISHGCTNDHVFALLPVGRCRYRVLGGQLKRINHSDDLIEVSACGSRVCDHQLHLLVGANHEDASHSEHGEGLGMNHSVQFTHLPIRIGDHRKVHGRALCLAYVFLPLEVAHNWVNRQPDDLDASFFELWLDLRHVAQLRGAHGREVLRVREEHAPAVTQPIVEADCALGGVCREVWCNVTQPDVALGGGVGFHIFQLCFENIRSSYYKLKEFSAQIIRFQMLEFRSNVC